MTSLIYRGWFQIAAVGLALFILTDFAMQYTLNITYLASFLLVGSFLVPITFFAYFYRQEAILDRNIHGGISFTLAAVVFFVSGLVGGVIAGILEGYLSFDSNWAIYLGVGGIEETAKLIFPVLVFLVFTRYRSEVDGLVFGIASGLGFAALETMGYGLSLWSSPSSTFGDLEQLLVVRGLLSPLGHAAWTGLICGAIWHYQGQGRRQVYMAAGYFLLAVVLHFLWNTAANTGQNYILYPSVLAIGAVGLFIVFRHLHHARQRSRDTLNQSSDANPNH